MDNGMVSVYEYDGNNNLISHSLTESSETKTAATEEPGEWITVRGVHIFIPEGKDPGDVIKEHFDDTKVDKPKKKQMSDNEVLEKVHKEHPEMPEKTVKKNLELYRGLETTFEKLNKKIEDNLKKDLPGNPIISGRVKTPDSSIGKVARKPKYADIRNLQDNVAVRATYNDVSSVKEAMKIVREKYDIVEEDNYIDQPKFDGYRSYHAIMKDKETGIETELQMRTQRQDTFANWAHKLYKPESDDVRHFVETHEEMSLKYQVDVGNYYSELDEGRKPKKPICPEPIMKVMMCL